MKPGSLGADRQCAFDGIKTYLSSLPVMKALMAGIPFQLYIAAEDVVIGIVFVICILAFLLLYFFRVLCIFPSIALAPAILVPPMQIIFLFRSASSP
jgi:hypothetical protein